MVQHVFTQKNLRQKTLKQKMTFSNFLFLKTLKNLDDFITDIIADIN